MGHGSKKWFKRLVCTNPSKKERPSENGHDEQTALADKSKFWQWKNLGSRDKTSVYKDMFNKYGPLKEEKAAICIQSKFRAYLARKSFRSLKGTVRLQALVQRREVRKQAATALQSMQSWIRIQSQIRARRSCMVTEGRIKQKKREHQMKLEAELHELEVDWLDGAETMEEIIARVQQREEAAVRRERAMAYAFSHQWRASSKSNLGYSGYEIDKTNWGWSWIERWIAARPWENRLLSQGMKDGLENNSSTNGHTNGHKHLVGVNLLKAIVPSTKMGQMNVKISSPEKVPSHDSDNYIDNSKEHPTIIDSEAKKKSSLPKHDKPAMQKVNKARQKVSQVVDAGILAS